MEKIKPFSFTKCFYKQNWGLLSRKCLNNITDMYNRCLWQVQDKKIKDLFTEAGIVPGGLRGTSQEHLLHLEL